jgi:hypothetical protein
LRAFLEARVQGKSPEVTVYDGARATITCLQMLAAARSGDTCAIDWKASLML